VPWLIRNYNVYDKVVILTVRTTKFTDKFFGYPVYDYTKRHNEYQFIHHWNDSMKNDIINGKEVPGIKRKIYDNLKLGLTNGSVPHKYSKLEKYYAEFKEFWRPVRFNGGYVGNGFKYKGPSWSLKHNLSQGISYGLLLPFLIIGILMLIREKNKYGILLIIILLIHTYIHVVLDHAINRYRIPIDPFIIIIAFYAINNLCLKFKSVRI